MGTCSFKKGKNGTYFHKPQNIKYADFQQKKLFEEPQKTLKFCLLHKNRKLRGKSMIKNTENYENENFKGENYEVTVYLPDKFCKRILGAGHSQ